MATFILSVSSPLLNDGTRTRPLKFGAQPPLSIWGKIIPHLLKSVVKSSLYAAWN